MGQRESTLPAPWFCTSGLPICETVNSCCFGWPSLWWFVTAALGNPNRRCGLCENARKLLEERPGIFIFTEGALTQGLPHRFQGWKYDLGTPRCPQTIPRWVLSDSIIIFSFLMALLTLVWGVQSLWCPELQVSCGKEHSWAVHSAFWP